VRYCPSGQRGGETDEFYPLAQTISGRPRKIAEILASQQKVALGVILKDFGVILCEKLFDARLARALLNEAGSIRDESAASATDRGFRVPSDMPR
jgi:hypothetical protein